MGLLLVKRKLHLHNARILILKNKQSELMRKYAEMEDAQGEYPENYSLYQDKIDGIDWKSELIRRKIEGIKYGKRKV